jgi:GTP1/Obg family GTP-binding protein
MARLIQLCLIHFSQFNFTKVAEDSQRLRSYFEDPKLNRDFQALSKSPVFEMDKARFQQYYQKVLTLKDNIEHVWTDGVVNMKSLATEQELYDRLIEVHFEISRFDFATIKLKRASKNWSQIVTFFLSVVPGYWKKVCRI